MVTYTASAMVEVLGWAKISTLPTGKSSYEATSSLLSLPSKAQVSATHVMPGIRGDEGEDNAPRFTVAPVR